MILTVITIICYRIKERRLAMSKNLVTSLSAATKVL